MRAVVTAHCARSQPRGYGSTIAHAWPSARDPPVHPPVHPPPARPQDFYSKPCWAHHPKPYADFIDFKKKEREALEAERKRAVRV